jgi:hypothetical protein
MSRENPFRRKWVILMPKDYFPWVDPRCFEDGEIPYLHTLACTWECKNTCNEKGVMMGKQYKWWKDGAKCTPHRWVRGRRFNFDN